MVDVLGPNDGDVLAIEDLDGPSNDLLISDVASSQSSGSVEAHARRALGGSFRAPASPSEICPALSPRGGYGDSPLDGGGGDEDEMWGDEDEKALARQLDEELLELLDGDGDVLTF